MTGPEIIKKVKALNLPKDSYVVFGSCPMAMAGIREANDIDMLVSSATFSKLKQMGWKQIQKGPKATPLVFDVFEAHETWDFSAYSPTLNQLLKTATTIDDVPFTALEEVRKWKAASSNPKFQRDVQLIDSYNALK